MELTEDTWRALARSSPWRWRSLHFTRVNEYGTVEAWLRRPGQLLVREENGRETLQSEPPRSSSSELFSITSVVAEGVDGQPFDLPTHVDAGPTLRPDGLVDGRDSWDVDDDDLFYENYLWVAMLDPVELGNDTTLEQLRTDTIAGREVWRAVVRAEDGYYPRCSCCPLLWSEASDRLEHESCGEPFVPADTYPDAYAVALDVGTGIVVQLEPIGAERETWFAVTIQGVDKPMDDVFTRRRRR